MVAVEQK